MNFRLIGTVLLLASFSFAAYSGTPKTPSKVDGCYQIGSAEELYGFAEMVNDGDETAAESCVRLTADIVVNENVLINDTLNKNDSLIPWIPINVFYGTFDGQGHTISGLYGTSLSYDMGFFIALVSATIKNLNIVDSYFQNSDGLGYLGSITAEGRNISIENCSILMTLTGKSYVGGFVGLVTQGLNIQNSSHSGKITSFDKTSNSATLGGLVGYFHTGKAFIKNSYHVGKIDNTFSSGGLFAVTGDATQIKTIDNTVIHIENSFVIGKENLVNKIGDRSEFHITNSFYQSSHSSDTAKTEAEFKDGTVALALHYGKDGDVWGQKIGTEAHPTLSSSITNVPSSIKISNIKFHTYDGDTTSYRSQYVEGISTTLPSPLRKNYIFEGWYTNAQFTDSAVTAISTADTGDLDLYARWLTMPNLIDGCYEIANKDDLYVFSTIVNGYFDMDQELDACGKLTADIVWNEKIDNDVAEPWPQIDDFQGSLDGQGHKISGIYITGSNLYNDMAFIKRLYGKSEESPASIKNLGFENIYNDACARIGGIASNIRGHVNFENIYVAGTVYTDCHASGIIAQKVEGSSKISITNSYFVSILREGMSPGHQPPLFNSIPENSELSITNSFFYYPHSGRTIPNSVNGNLITYGTLNLTNFYISDSLYLDAYIPDSLYQDTAKFPVIKADSAQFANGTIAKALHDYNENGIDGSIWGQRVGIDLYPVHTGKIDTVKITSSSSSKTTSSSTSPKSSSSASSSSKAKSSSSGKSSSSKAKSSSSKKTSILSAIPVQETAKVYSQGRNIFVEQYNGLVTIFDLNGNLVRDAYSNGHTEIRLQRAGTYIVKIGAKSRRISLTTDH
ncbi:InlB B-repeat-containing protein [Candidatus Saccharibacteria bacterium]|nr:InlB B-repeat-containing protein [Candidatus Saccharibacteria bacterium]